MGSTAALPCKLIWKIHELLFFVVPKGDRIVVAVAAIVAAVATKTIAAMAIKD